jgi:hypothetical protein
MYKSFRLSRRVSKSLAIRVIDKESVLLLVIMILDSKLQRDGMVVLIPRNGWIAYAFQLLEF